MIEQSKVNLRCMFCNKREFINLDEVMLHQYSVNNKGQNICPHLDYRIDPSKANELFPMKVCGKKYAPKNHDGYYMCLDSDGKVTKKQLVRELLND